MVAVTVYADDTGLFTEEECNYCNIVDLIVPYWIVKEWYTTNEKENKESAMNELHVSEEEATFERWFNSVCICDDFIGFYDYCVVKGVIPNLLEYENDNKRYKICYEDYNKNIQTLFEGTYDECRRYGRMMKWSYLGYDLQLEIE